MKQRGFTLLELMLAIALGVILLAIGIPALSDLLKENTANYESERLMKHLRFARNEAISEQQTVSACLINNANQCVSSNSAQLLVFADTNNNSQLDNGETELARTPTFSSSAAITSTRTRVLFAPDGTSLGTNMTIKVCVSQEPEIDLVIAVSGRSSRTDTTTICP